MADPHDEVPEGGRKRRRTAQACLNCRTRKTKCDGQRPSCSNCDELSVECHYDVSDTSTNLILPKNYVTGLEDRLRLVEQNLQRHDDLLKGHLSNCAPRTAEMESTDAVRPVGAQVEAQTDGLGIAFLDESTEAFFGESANITFTRQLIQATSAIFGLGRVAGPKISLEKDGDSTSTAAQLAGYPSRWHTAAYVSGTDQAAVRSPSQGDCERLLGIYFNTMGLLFPFLHEATFWQRWREARTTGQSHRTFLGIVNMMLANAVSNDREGYATAKHRLTESNRYYTKAVAIVGELIDTSVSLEMVQYLLLLTLYRQGSQGALRTWIMHGQLVQAALSIGLHSGHTRGSTEGIENESRKRTWLAIYCLDQILSATLGRPSSIPDEQMILQQPVPWPSNNTGQSELQVESLTTRFLSVSIELYRHMSRSLAKQYGRNLGLRNRAIDELSEIQLASELRCSLQAWVASLPPELALLKHPQLAQELGLHSREARLRTILTLRYHSIYLLIHRPLITGALKRLPRSRIKTSRASHARQLMVSEASVCLDAAKSTVEIAHAAIVSKAGKRDHLGVWFFNLYYLFSATLVIYAFELLRHFDDVESSEHSVGSGLEYLQRAEEAISRLDSGNPLIDTCAKYIAYLRKLLSSPQVESAASPSQLNRDEDGNSGVTMENVTPPLWSESVGIDEFYSSGLALSEFLDLDFLNQNVPDLAN